MTVLCNVIQRRCPWRCVLHFVYALQQVLPSCYCYLSKLRKDVASVGKLHLLSHCKLYKVSETFSGLHLHSGPTHWKCNRSVLRDNCNYSVPRVVPSSKWDLLAINACIFPHLNTKATHVRIHYSDNFKKRGHQKNLKSVSSTTYTEFSRFSTAVVQMFVHQNERGRQSFFVYFS